VGVGMLDRPSDHAEFWWPDDWIEDFIPDW